MVFIADPRDYPRKCRVNIMVLVLEMYTNGLAVIFTIFSTKYFILIPYMYNINSILFILHQLSLLHSSMQ